MVYAKSLTANQKPGNLKFCPPFYKRFLIGWNPEGISKKGEASGLSKKSEYLEKAIKLIKMNNFTKFIKLYQGHHSNVY